ncbi:hypothetical protein Chor_007775 [Crotalus horridus]
MMATAAGPAVVVEVSVSSTGSSSSDTSSTGEEERMRRLFQTCDGDGDGFISSLPLPEREASEEDGDPVNILNSFLCPQVDALVAINMPASFCMNDLLMVCRQLNMEESVIEIMHQLGADEHGKISFQDFTRCRMQLVGEIRKEEVELSVKLDDSCKKKNLRDRIASWPTSSNNSLGSVGYPLCYPIWHTVIHGWMDGRIEYK